MLSKNKLNVVGVAEVQITVGNKSSIQTVYLVRDLNIALLGLPAIKALEVLPSPRVDNISSFRPLDSVERAKTEFPELFNKLVCMKGRPFEIHLCEGISPRCLYTPRNVPFPLRPAVKKELKLMEELGVIFGVNDATDWCSGLVVVAKPNGRVRLCVDFTHLNKAVKREHLLMPDVQSVLSQISTGARYFHEAGH